MEVLNIVYTMASSNYEVITNFIEHVQSQKEANRFLKLPKLF